MFVLLGVNAFFTEAFMAAMLAYLPLHGFLVLMDCFTFKFCYRY